MVGATARKKKGPKGKRVEPSEPHGNPWTAHPCVFTVHAAHDVLDAIVDDDAGWSGLPAWGDAGGSRALVVFNPAPAFSVVGTWRTVAPFDYRFGALPPRAQERLMALNIYNVCVATVPPAPVHDIVNSHAYDAYCVLGARPDAERLFRTHRLRTEQHFYLGVPDTRGKLAWLDPACVCARTMALLDIDDAPTSRSAVRRAATLLKQLHASKVHRIPYAEAVHGIDNPHERAAFTACLLKRGELMGFDFVFPWLFSVTQQAGDAPARE